MISGRFFYRAKIIVFISLLIGVALGEIIGIKEALSKGVFFIPAD